MTSDSRLSFQFLNRKQSSSSVQCKSVLWNFDQVKLRTLTLRRLLVQETNDSFFWINSYHFKDKYSSILWCIQLASILLWARECFRRHYELLFLYRSIATLKMFHFNSLYLRLHKKRVARLMSTRMPITRQCHNLQRFLDN